jgi:hypothetical protein
MKLLNKLNVLVESIEKTKMHKSETSENCLKLAEKYNVPVKAVEGIIQDSKALTEEPIEDETLNDVHEEPSEDKTLNDAHEEPDNNLDSDYVTEEDTETEDDKEIESALTEEPVKDETLNDAHEEPDEDNEEHEEICSTFINCSNDSSNGRMWLICSCKHSKFQG